MRHAEIELEKSEGIKKLVLSPQGVDRDRICLNYCCYNRYFGEAFGKMERGGGCFIG